MESIYSAPRNFSAGLNFGAWTLLRYIGFGGNSEVWLVENERGEQGALKALIVDGPNKRQQFIQEIDIMKSLPNGLSLPIIDWSYSREIDIPEYYVTPLAQTLKGILRRKLTNPLLPLDAMYSVSKAVDQLHSLGIYHCDVKIENIYKYRKNWILGDFGLAIRRHQLPLTSSNEFLGSRGYIPPELQVIPAPMKLDWAKCDVYSWGISLGIVTQYNNDVDWHSESYAGRHQDIPSAILDLRRRAIEDDPASRPNMREVSEKMAQILAI